MMKTINKKERAQRLFAENIELFRCPLCHQGFLPDTSSGLRCRNNHHFDFARNGYLNLLATRQNTDYDRELFQARREVFEQGVYDPLVTRVSTLIRDLGFTQATVVDAGCGEGSLLVRLGELLDGPLLGVDIARDGIRLAGAHNTPVMWCVADLAQLPLRESSVDVVLNMLSPANYGEFRRVLKPQGYLIKVLPGTQYLQEVRTSLGDLPDYSNDGVLANLEANLLITNRERLHYHVPIAPEIWPSVFKMTPLTEHRVTLGEPAPELTIDLEIVCGVF